MDLYEKVKEITDSRGISIRKVELMAGIGNGTIGQWRYANPKLDTLKKVALALGVPLEVLLMDGVKK